MAAPSPVPLTSYTNGHAAHAPRPTGGKNVVGGNKEDQCRAL